MKEKLEQELRAMIARRGDLERSLSALRTQILSAREKLSHETDINELDWSSRTRALLNNLGIRTVGEVIQKPDSELLKYRNLGRQSLIEIRTKLAEYWRRL